MNNYEIEIPLFESRHEITRQQAPPSYEAACQLSRYF